MGAALLEDVSSGSSVLLIIGVDVGSVRRADGFLWTSSDDLLRGEGDPAALGAVLVHALDAGSFAQA